MLASGMTTGISNMAYPVPEDASTTSQASTALSTALSSQAAAKGADSLAGSTATTTGTVKKVNYNLGVESKVREYFSDLPIMAEVSKCESRYRQFASDGSVFRGIINSQDVGVMQVNEYYHADRAKKLGIDIHTLKGNLDYARLLYKEEGTEPWSSSRPCWIKSDVAKAMYAPKLAENIK